ncbi:hypothetical protein BDQ17DRAFT_1333382 [Cyathus striatus]|nr:hypothetical protein BDQ17DRAFT_1333382 [Cyathus striatus]
MRIMYRDAGIGGLTLALSLSRLMPEDRIQIHIYERAQEIMDIGSGLIVWPRTWAIFKKLEVNEALMKLLDYEPNNEEGMKIKKSDQLSSEDIYEFYHEDRYYRGQAVDTSSEDRASSNPGYFKPCLLPFIFISLIVLCLYLNHDALLKPMLEVTRFINLVPLAIDYSKHGTLFEGPTATVADKDKVKGFFEGWSEEVGVLLNHAKHTFPLGACNDAESWDAYTLSRLVSKTIRHNIAIERVTETYTKAHQPLGNLVAQKSYDMSHLTSFRAPGYEYSRNAGLETQLLEKFPKDFLEKFE